MLGRGPDLHLCSFIRFQIPPVSQDSNTSASIDVKMKEKTPNSFLKAEISPHIEQTLLLDSHLTKELF